MAASRTSRSLTIIEVPVMRRLAPVTPGELLKEEFLGPMGISQYRLAKEIDVPAQRIGEIVAGRRAGPGGARYGGGRARARAGAETHPAMGRERSGRGHVGSATDILTA